MNAALQQILLAAPLFVLVFVGYGIVHWGGWPKAAADALAKFVFTIALPAMLFRLMSGGSEPLRLVTRPFDGLDNLHVVLLAKYRQHLRRVVRIDFPVILSQCLVKKGCGFGDAA